MNIEGDNSVEAQNQKRMDLFTVLKEKPEQEALLLVENELLSRERVDLSVLSVEDQYDIIIDKVGKHENSVIPDPVLSPKDLSTKYDEIEESDLTKILAENELFGKMLRSKLSGEPLTIKIGVDPTAGQIHLGHGITLRMMRRFQQMGHKIQFIIGDATAMVGDGTDRMTARQPLSREQIDANMKNYRDQASRIIDISPQNPNVEVFHNSEWLNKSMMEWLPILQNISASRSMDRRDFQERINKGGSVSLGELMYSTFMAYDSVHLKSNIEIGGLDQYLNFLQTRNLMSKHHLEPETVVTVDLLPGTTGATDSQGRLVKMSKSLGNYIPLNEDPVGLYTKVMSIPDALMPIWFRELTEISSLELDELLSRVSSKDVNPTMGEDANIDPIVLKRMLARVIVASLNSGHREVALNAERGSMDLVGKDSKLRPDNATKIVVEEGESLMEALRKIGSQINNDRLLSNSRVRRLVEQGGISVLSNKPDATDDYVKVSTEMLSEEIADVYIRIGKKQICHIGINHPEV